MEQFSRELSYSLTPIPQLFLDVGNGIACGVEGLFTKIGLLLSEGDGCTLQYAWMQAVQKTEKLNLPEHTKDVLLDFSKEFGRHGIDESLSCVDMTVRLLKEEQSDMAAFSKERLKCIVTITICTGLALAVILI